MKWNVGAVKLAFSGRLVGSVRMKLLVCEALLLLPDEIVKYVTRNVWFISSPDDAWAFTFRGSDISGQHLIVISDELLKQKKSDIFYTIVHEIGHVMLGHQNSMGVEQTREEIRNQEKEANRFARQYLHI